MCRRTDPYLEVLNGAGATVETVETRRGRLTLALDASGMTTMDAGYIERHLDYGYALRDGGQLRSPGTPAARQLLDALSRRAAESPARALVERQSRCDTGAEMTRERVNGEIELREQLLTGAHDRLGGLGWLGRRRHGDELTREIDAHRTVLGRPHNEHDDLSRSEDSPASPTSRA